MTVLAFATEFNAPFRKDATHVFQPRASAFADLHRGDVILFNDRRPMKRRGEQILATLSYSWPKLESVAFFCHGWSRGIEAGFDLRKRVGLSVDVLASAIAQVSLPSVRVPLFCCSTGRTWGQKQQAGDGGFADALRDALCRAGATECRVDAHTTDGHATRNPYVRRFEGLGSKAGGVGGGYLVQPKGALWRPWIRALRDRRSNFDVSYPFFDTEVLLEKLSQGA